MSNSIIDEVRAARASIAAEHGYDRAKILKWARAEQAAIKARNSNDVAILTPDPSLVPSDKTVRSSARKSKRALRQA